MSVKTFICSLFLVTATEAATASLSSRPASPSLSTQQSSATSTGTVPALTLNAIDASFKWWYSKTIEQHVSTISVLFDEDDKRIGWTLIPPSTTWDIRNALSTFACDSTPAKNTLSGGRVVSYTSCDYEPSPVAASTTAVYLSAYKLPSATSGTDTTTLPDVRVRTTPSATIAFPGVPTTISPGTPFVYFTAYEVVDIACFPQGTGRSCSTTRQTSYLPEPYVFEYTGPSPEKAKDVSAVVTGTLDPAFPAFVQQTAAAAGTWAAEPTVILVIVQVIVAVAVLAAHVESSANSLGVPTYPAPTANTRLQDGFSDQPAQTSVRAEPVRTSPAPQTKSEQHDTSGGQGDPASYIATGIGMTYPPPGPMATQKTDALSQKQSPQQTSLRDTGATGTSSPPYTPGSAAAGMTYDSDLLTLAIGSLLFALAYG